MIFAKPTCNLYKYSAHIYVSISECSVAADIVIYSRTYNYSSLFYELSKLNRVINGYIFFTKHFVCDPRPARCFVTPEITIPLWSRILWWISSVNIKFISVQYSLSVVWGSFFIIFICLLMSVGLDLYVLWPLLLTWFNFNPSMDK